MEQLSGASSKGKLQPLPGNIRSGWKVSPRINGLAYFASLSLKKVCKISKGVCGKTSQPDLVVSRKARAVPNGAPFRSFRRRVGSCRCKQIEDQDGKSCQGQMLFIKLVYLLDTNRQNKQDCLLLERLSRLVSYKARASLSVAPFRCFFQGEAPAFTSKY
jgi:hypothetical protein